MGKLEKTITFLSTAEKGRESTASLPDPRAVVLTSLIYIGVVLSVPADRPGMLFMFALYPIIASPLCGLSFTDVFLRSLMVVPLVAMIAIFNPIIDTAPVFRIGDTVVTHGWLTFISIIFRGLFAVQALLLVVGSHGFSGLCHAMRRLGVPAILTVQLQMVFRYMRVLLEEALTMKRAREARGYGKKRMSLKMWGTMTGQLFLRTVDRSERIHTAMKARGFTGTIPSYTSGYASWSGRDTLWIAVWILVIATLRILDPAVYFSTFIKF